MACMCNWLRLGKKAGIPICLLGPGSTPLLVGKNIAFIFYSGSSLYFGIRREQCWVFNRKLIRQLVLPENLTETYVFTRLLKVDQTGLVTDQYQTEALAYILPFRRWLFCCFPSWVKCGCSSF